MNDLRLPPKKDLILFHRLAKTGTPANMALMMLTIREASSRTIMSCDLFGFLRLRRGERRQGRPDFDYRTMILRWFRK